ncbi:MAG: Hsp33 family molecular chaperone HslO [Thiomicrospira sp.]|jgi:molecular chaperone Hsp33|nr:Hsp33 family molecular chaperone HslO [Thiomicrospira sp.]
MSQDVIQRFLFKEHAIRGQYLHLDQAWLSMLNERHYPASLVRLLGELTAFSALLANGMKYEGRLTLQVQGNGPVNLLVVDIDHQLHLRGLAKTQAPLEGLDNANQLLGDGQILVTLENRQTDHFYQSYVPREDDDLTVDLQGFLTQSEQLESRLFIALNDQAIGALYLQKMPETDGHDADAWDRISHLASTVKKDELLNLDIHSLLTRLFHEEQVELYPPRSLEYVCPRNREQIATMIKALGEEQARQILAEQGEIVVFNDMCNYHERFNQADLDDLFKADLNA